MDDLILPEADPKQASSKIFKKPLSDSVREKQLSDNNDILDVDPDDDDDDDDVIPETSFCQLDALPLEHPFSLLYLSSEDSSRDEALMS